MAPRHRSAERPAMLERVLEPEVMDSPDEALAYDAMDHAAVNRTVVEDLCRDCPELTAAGEDADREATVDVLDLGTGTAQIPILLCRQHLAPRVMAVDLAAAMLDLARANVEVSGLTHRIQLDRVDAKRLPYADRMFAVVMSNSIVHHIPQPRDVLAEAVRVLAPGGLLFVRDLLRPEDDAAVLRLVETYAAGATDRQRRLFDDSLRAALSLEEVRALVVELGLSPEGVQATSDRHWTLSMRRS